MSARDAGGAFSFMGLRVRETKLLPPFAASYVDAHGRCLAIIYAGEVMVMPPFRGVLDADQCASLAVRLDASPAFIQKLKATCDGQG